MKAQDRQLWFSHYLRTEPAGLVLLTGLAIVFFLFVGALSRIYEMQQVGLATRWSARGVADLDAHRYQNAVVELRTALRYSRGNPSYQLSLAEALLGLRRTAEAATYLSTLWNQQPENGQVNLDLARVAAVQGQTQQALRYYHDAIYANWPDHQEAAIRDARIELIDYLLSINAKAQAQSELISLEVFLGDDLRDQVRLGELFMRTQDYDHALAAYRRGLTAFPTNAVALSGAGNAAFELGRYSLAERYLAQSVQKDPADKESLVHLKLAQLVLKMDPYLTDVPVVQRNNAVIQDFSVAGDRLKSCPIAASYVSSIDPKQDLAKDWARLKPEVTQAGLRRNPDLLNESMQMAFLIERQASAWCNSPSEADTALLLVAKLHEGS